MLQAAPPNLLYAQSYWEKRRNLTRLKIRESIKNKIVVYMLFFPYVSLLFVLFVTGIKA